MPLQDLKQTIELKLLLIAADCLKLNFPAAFSASLLAWGLLEFPDVSQASPESCVAARTHLQPILL